MDCRLELVAVPVTDVDEQPWGRFVHFSGPDGSSWAVQQIVKRG